MLTIPRSAAVCALVAVALVAVAAAPAGARPLGANGQIAFGRYDPLVGDTVAYTINPDGTHEQQLLPLALEAPRWSPDGARIAGCCGQTPGGHGAAIVVDRDNPADHVALPEADPDHLDLYCGGAWSPDGARLACEGYGVSDDGLNGVYTIRSSDGGGLRRLTTNPGGSDQPGDFSPDGRRIVISHFPGCCPSEQEFIAQSGLYVSGVNGGAERKVAPCCGSHGSWSPQGNEILFSRHVTDDVHSSIWVVHADGSDLHQIDVQGPSGQFPCGAPNADPAAGGCFDPRWSPDGRKIVFVRGDPDRGLGSDIFTMNADGTGVTQITHGTADQPNEAPDWGTHPLAG